MDETLNEVYGVLTSSKSRLYNSALLLFKKRLEAEVNSKNPLQNNYLRTLLAVNSIAPVRFSSAGKEIFDLFAEAFLYLDRELDIRDEDDCRSNFSLENLAFISTLAASSLDDVCTLISRNGPYSSLFDALFKTSSSLPEKRDSDRKK